MEKRQRYSIAVDFDGVIHSYTTPWIDAATIPDPPVEGAIDWLNEISEAFDVVVFTTRAQSDESCWAVRHYLRDHGFEGWATVAATNTKPPCLIYLDDRAYRFEGPGTFPTAGQIHRARPWNK